MAPTNKLLPTSKVLSNVFDSDEKQFEKFYSKAVQITKEVFGSKRTLFNPIYVSNICLADCPYCGFRISNKKMPRKTLKPEETIQEARFLQNRGIENILVLAGDYKHDKYVEMLLANIKAIKQNINPKWLGIEVATLEADEYKQLKNAGAESVTVFQETYNRKRYDELHQGSEYKSSFDFRYNAQERALQAGFDEVGLGVLYGIGFWKEDTIAMAEHAIQLQKKFPSAKLRFSLPRLQESIGQTESSRTEVVTEEQLLKAIVGIRLLFPTASLVLTGRESTEFLAEHTKIVNVLGYNGSTIVGGYTLNSAGLAQFKLNSKDSFNIFISKLKKNGFELNC
jgi:2-iminoacetate synthase